MPAALRRPQPSVVGPAAAGPASTVSINAGGPATGGFWADQFFTGGATYGNSATIDMSQITSNPPPAAIFNTERYGAMTYTIPDRSGAQTVTLYFAETYLSGPGQRLFDVTINGTTVLSRLRHLRQRRRRRTAPSPETFTTTADSSGQVVIQFISGTENPKINGITVTGGGTTAHAPARDSDPNAGRTAHQQRRRQAKRRLRQEPARWRTASITIESNGTRSYILRAPDNYDSNHPYRLVLAYHWMGGTAEQVADGTGATESPVLRPLGPGQQQHHLRGAGGPGFGPGHGLAEHQRRGRGLHRRDPRPARGRAVHRHGPDLRHRVQLRRRHVLRARMRQARRVPGSRALLGRAAQRLRRRHEAHRLLRVARPERQRPRHLATGGPCATTSCRSTA